METSKLSAAVSHLEHWLTCLSRVPGCRYFVLSTFFWLTIKPFQTLEGSEVFLERYHGERRKGSWPVWKALARNHLRDILASVLRWVRGARREPSWFGTPAATADIYVQTWLYENDVEKFLSDGVERYWGKIALQIPEGKKFQFLVLPLFKISPEQAQKLVATGAVVFNPNISLSPLGALRYGARSLYTFVVATPLLGLKHAAYLSLSFLNFRYERAVRILKEVGRCALNPKGLVLVPWEGQPEQRALCRASRQQGLSVWGYIHSSATNNPSYLAQFQSAELAGYFPDRLLVHGSDLPATLAPANWDEREIDFIHCLRFKARPKEDFIGKLFLPYDVQASLEILGMVAKLIDEGSVEVAQVLNHPKNASQPAIQHLISQLRLSSAARQVIVGGFSAVIFEALEVGCEVIHVTPSGIGEMDVEAYPSIQRERLGEHVTRLSLAPDRRGALLDFQGLGTALGDLLRRAKPALEV